MHLGLARNILSRLRCGLPGLVWLLPSGPQAVALTVRLRATQEAACPKVGAPFHSCPLAVHMDTRHELRDVY